MIVLRDCVCLFVCYIAVGGRHQLGVSGMRGELSLPLSLCLSLSWRLTYTKLGKWGGGDRSSPLCDGTRGNHPRWEKKGNCNLESID